MRPIPEELAADLFDLHARLAMDRARGGLRSVREYQELFPGLEDEVRAAHASATSNRESEPTEPQVVEPERRVGRYRLLRELGRGGQGTVHLAEDTHLGRRVALKMLTGVAQFSSDARKRFQREAETASRLDHPSICTIYESGFDGDLAYIAMRFVEGETLSRRLARVRSMRDTGARGGERAPCAPGDRAELATTLRFFEEASRALHAAHEAGVIHRDVKPGNLVVSTDVKPVVLDFGLARALESTGEQITQTGDQVGTPSYMSPEQIDAQGRPLDRRTDVYSLGATLYECLVLEAPFQKPTLASLYHAILREPPRDPRSLTRSIPRELVIVLQTALEKDRDRRYTTALDFAEDLRRVRELEPIRARRAGLGLRTLRWVQRHPARAIALGAILVILALGVVTRVIATDLAMKRVLERDRAVESRLLDLLADTPMRGTRHDWRAELEEYERALADYGIDLGTEGDHEANAQTVRAAGVRDPGLREKLLGALRHVVELVARARLADPALARGIQDDLAPESAGDSRCTQLEVAANDLVETLEEDPWRRALWSAFRARARGAADELDPFITAALGPERSAADSLLVADLAYSFREREVVRRLYDVAERKPSDDPNVRYAVRVSRGLLRHRLGDLGGAWTDLRAACDVRPRVGAVHQALARIAQAREDPSAAEEHAERAVQLDAGDGHAWLLLANARARQSELAGAEAAAHRALALEPDFANARELLGNIAWSRGEELDAFQEWDLAAAASGDASALWARVGSTALSRLALEELSDVFASVGAGPEISKPIWIARARQSLAAGRASAAVDALRIARRDAPDDPQVTLELGRAECAAGDRVAGLALLGEAAAARSEDAQVHIALAEALLAHGDPHRARPTLERVLELQPAHVEARIALAGLELRPGGDPLRAREILDGIASDRRTGEWHAMRSQAWIALGDFVESSGELFRGLERFPRDPVLHALARANHSDPRQRVDLDARYVALERAHPQVAELLVLRAHLARRAGDRASARSHLDRARGVDPRCIEALIETSALEFEARRFGDAVTAVREGLVLDAGVVAKAEELAAALDGVGAVDELFDLTLFTLDRAPDSRVGLALHARAALALGQERHLATRARRVRERDPERSDALCIEARALDALGDEESARRLLTTAAAARLEDAQVRSTFEGLWGPGAGHVSGEPDASLSQGTPLSAEELLLRRDYQRAAEAYLAMRADGRAPALGFDAARAAARAAELAARNGAEASSRGVGSSAPAFDPAELAELALDILEREHLQRAALAAGSLDRDTLQRLRAHSRRVLDTRDLAFLRRAPREARWAERARDHFLRVRSFVRELSTRDT